MTPFPPPPQACLAGDKVPKDKTRVVVKCRAEAEDDEERQEFNICTIIGGVVESCALDLIFGGYAEFYAEGAHPVHLTGYFMPEFGDEDDDEREAYMRQMEEDEDDDSEEEEDSEEDDDSEDEDDFGVLEAFDEDDDDSEEEDDDSEEEESDDPAPRKTKKGGVVIEELDDDEKEKTPEEAPKKEEKAAAKETKKRPAADAPEAPAPAPKKEKKKEKDEDQPKKEPPKKEAAAKGQHAREFKNGMEIVTVAQGPPGGKQAKPGKRVTMRYVGRLQSGKIFDQTKGNATFAFRLGVGEVIRGWDVGVDGMRVGDKRRLTIPHTLAYGKKGVRGAIPGGATLIFDVELVSVA